MDNLGAHQVAGVREAIEAAGAGFVHLPPYSPDLKQIDLVLSKFKWLSESASARTGLEEASVTRDSRVDFDPSLISHSPRSRRQRCQHA